MSYKQIKPLSPLMTFFLKPFVIHLGLNTIHNKVLYVSIRINVSDKIGRRERVVHLHVECT